MLVLSRRPTQQIVFPSLGITLSVVRIQGNTVRIGIDAPSDVRVVRGELTREEREQQQQRDPRAPAHLPSVSVDPHRVRNCLNTAVLALRVASKQAQTDPGESESMIGKALCELDQINQSLDDGQLGEPTTQCRWT